MNNALPRWCSALRLADRLRAGALTVLLLAGLWGGCLTPSANRLDATPSTVPPTAGDGQPPGGPVQQSGQGNLNADVSLETALAKIKDLEVQVDVLTARAVTVSYVNMGGGGLLGLAFYFVSRWTGWRPASPEQRAARQHRKKVAGREIP
jgi:hypothetical protein